MAIIPSPIGPFDTLTQSWVDGLFAVNKAILGLGASSFAPINIQSFTGVDPTGVIDSSTGFQAAFDFCFGPASAPNGNASYLNKPLWIPPGRYKLLTPPLLTKVQGGWIFGAGRFATQLFNPNGTGVLRTDGFQYSRIEGMELNDQGTTATVFDLNKLSAGGPSLQSCTFSDLYINGGGIGVNIGDGGLQGSEMLFQNCFIASAAIYGVRTGNYNALQNTFVGGNIQNCAIGAQMSYGTMCFYSVGFQESATYDIVQLRNANDAIVIAGCRTESQNFFSGGSGMAVIIEGVSQLSSTPGVFVNHSGHVTINSINSVAGNIKSANLTGSISNALFGRNDWLDTSDLHAENVKLTNVWYNNEAGKIAAGWVTPDGLAIGVTCPPGAPSASYATVNGMTTHC